MNCTPFTGSTPDTMRRLIILAQTAIENPRRHTDEQLVEAERFLTTPLVLKYLKRKAA